MKKTTCLGATILLLLCAACVPAAQAQATTTPTASQMQEVRTSFNTLFQAMKDGDVATIEQYSSGEMGSEYKTLLEKNGDYPAFLRNFYRGATFSIANVTKNPDGDVIVNVAIQLTGGSRSITQLYAKRFDGAPATWKVTGVAKPPRTSPHR
jgi:hypothetical protein